MYGDITQFEKDYRNFHDALIEDVVIGPRHEVTVILCPVVWHGNTGMHEGSVNVRFGKIQHFASVVKHFKALPGLRSEVGYLGIDLASKKGKGGNCQFKFVAERRNFEFTFCCGSVMIEQQETVDV
jgi:hypothetical protein